MPLGPGGVGGMKRVRLLQSLKQSKVSTDDGKKTSVAYPQDDRLEASVLKKQRKGASSSDLGNEPSQYSEKFRQHKVLRESERKLELIQILTSEAMERFFRIALTDLDMAKSLEDSLIRAVKMGQIVGKVSEDNLISYIQQVNTERSKLRDYSNSSGLENSKKRIFGSPFSQAPSQSTYSCILEKTPSKNRQKQGRSPASGQKLDQQVKKHGKYKILFLPGETDAMNFNLDLSNGIGIIVRTNAEIKGAIGWDDVSEESKAVCYTRLFEWFDIEDWADKRVQEIINAKFKNAFTRWRCTLHKLYDTLLADNIDPRNICPRPDLTMEKWLEACDFIEDIDFQRRSHVNSENRNKKLFNHTSGKRTMLGHYKEMEKFLELDSAKAEIVHLTKAHTEQGKKIDKMESQMAMMLQILQHIPGIPSDFCRSS